jgi:GWxTD domain-containing protein
MAVLIAGVAASPVTTSAQLARDLVLQADSLLGAGDSSAALHTLDAAVLARPKDAAAWSQRGLVAWRLARAEERIGFMKRVANDSLVRMADSSLSIAVALAPDNARYLVDLGRFDLTSNSAAVRGRATKLFERAVASAQKSGDSLALSLATDEMGMTWWRRYVDRADRHIYSVILHNVKERTFTRDPRSIAYFVDNQTIREAAQDWSGQVEYLKATEFFTQAVALDPDNERAFRHEMMLFVDRKRWMEAQHAARLRLLRHPADPWGWMVEGLAAHRLVDAPGAAAAFDSALKYMSPSEHARFDRVARVLTPRDSAFRARLPELDQEADAEMFWLLADPLWATPDNEGRLEVMSRVVFSELRFTVEEFDIHGADTDRGEVFVRYGPPPAIISFPADPNGEDADSRIRVLWWYTKDETFLFRELPTYAVANLEPEDLNELKRLRDTIPVVFTNAGERNMVDSIRVQLVRFRAGSDSGDVFVAAALPIGRMIRNVDLARGAVDISIKAYTWRAQPVFVRTMHEVFDFTNAPEVTTHSWRTRLRSGSFMFRVEALQPDGRHGARAASRIEIVGESGFGLSDLLVADQVTRLGVGQRWSDFLISPNLAVVDRAKPFALLWETYDLKPDHGSDKYKVTVTVQRIHGGGLGDFVAKIVGGAASAVGLSGSGADKVSLTYPREIPATPVAVDYVSLDLGQAPEGSYLVTVDVLDLVSNATTRQQSQILVVE